MDKLKPCPFCGAKFPVVTRIVTDGDARVYCSKIAGGCGVETLSHATAEEAVKAWNMRSFGWIPCSERLPEKDGRYLCVWLDNCVTATFWFSNKHFRFSAEDTCEIDNLITHWMPLPEPPEMENEMDGGASNA